MKAVEHPFLVFSYVFLPFFRKTPASDQSSFRHRALEAAQCSSTSSVLLLSDDVRHLLYGVTCAEELRQAADALKTFVARSASARVHNASGQRMNRLLARDTLILCRAMLQQGGMEVREKKGRRLPK